MTGSSIPGGWDTPTVGVDSAGGIVVAAVSVEFGSVWTSASTDGGTTFSTPAQVPTPEGVGYRSRIVGTDNKFELFVPTLDVSTGVPYSLYRYESTSFGSSGVTWSGANAVLLNFSEPAAFSPPYCTILGACAVLWYSPYPEASGYSNGDWSVTFPIHNNIGGTYYNNAYICTSFRGCGVVNAGPADQFLGATVTSGDRAPWVTYSLVDAVQQGPLVSQQSIYFPSGGSAIGAQNYTNSVVLGDWYQAPAGTPGCGTTYTCWQAGDYQGISANPYASSSVSFVSGSPIGTALVQQFLQDPDGTTPTPNFAPDFVSFPMGADFAAQPHQVLDPSTQHGRFASSLWIMSHGRDAK
jgi:hypothetical protein